mgnify:CR=1 FL=1
MMMPANFTAVNSEVVYGGADLFSILADTTAPVWGAANVKQFNTNLITIVGNEFVKDTLKNTLGVAFGGTWFDKTGKTDDDGDEIKNTIFGKNGNLHNWLGAKDGDKKMSGLNKFMQGVGVLSAVYTLGTSTAKSYVGEADPFGVTGGKV